MKAKSTLFLQLVTFKENLSQLFKLNTKKKFYNA
jgi:hypothetical protein